MRHLMKGRCDGMGDKLNYPLNKEFHEPRT